MTAAALRSMTSQAMATTEVYIDVVIDGTVRRVAIRSVHYEFVHGPPDESGKVPTRMTGMILKTERRD